MNKDIIKMLELDGNTEEEVLCSKTMNKALENIVHAQSGRNDIKVTFSKKVCTDNKIVYVNPWLCLKNITLTLVEKVEDLFAQAFHEMLHLIFTIFGVLYAIWGDMNKCSNNSKYDSIKKRCEKFSNNEKTILQNILNIVEDSAIEFIGGKKFGAFLGRVLYTSNQRVTRPSIAALQKKGATDWQIMEELLLNYAIVGKELKAPSNLVALFEKAKPMLVVGREHSATTFERFEVAYAIFLLCRDIIQKDIKENAAKTPDFSDLENLLENLEALSQNGVGESETPPKIIVLIDGDGSNDGGEGKEIPEDAIIIDLRKGENEGKITNNPSQGKGRDNSKPFDDGVEELVKEAIETSLQDANDSVTLDKENKKDVHDAFSHLPKLHSELKPELQAKTTLASCEKNNDELYDEIVEEFTQEIDDIEETILKFIKSHPETMEYCNRGKKFSVRRLPLYKSVKNIYERKVAPERPNDLLVVLLVDCSGSMQGKNIAQAKKIAIVLNEVCSRLRIPCLVVGHYESGDTILTHYKEWDVPSKYVASITTNGCNNDGIALSYIHHRVLERHEDKKWVISISDGSPNGQGFKGESARDFCENIVNEMRDDDIVVTGIGCSSSKEENNQIREIYGEENSLAISDMSILPELLLEYLEDMLFN